MKVSCIITCAGKGARAGFEKNKLLYKINGETVMEKTFNVFYRSGLIDEYILTISESDYDFANNTFGDRAKIVIGGETRTESVKNALRFTTGDIVLIHDGARPFVTVEEIADCIKSVKEYGTGISAYTSTNTVCLAEDGVVRSVLGKGGVYIVNTPQGFKTKEIAKAYTMAGSMTFPDDSSLYEKFIGKVHLSSGKESNKKLTFHDDFTPSVRIGTGFDCHRFIKDRKLVLGGVIIPSDMGLKGHSDADVLTHAIMDALLSACALRDIGYHFPDTDNKYKDISSMVLLERVTEMIRENGYEVQNVSAVIMAEKPKLSKFIPAISKNLADNLGIDENNVGITATTLEGLGFVGREEGICVQANCIVIKKA